MSFTTSNEVREHIRQIFGKDVEIREGKIPLRIQPTPQDLEGANPHDPGNCVFVHSVKRMYGSQVVIFFKKVAYLDMVDEDGVRRVSRYLISKEATERLSRFDRGESFPLGAAITLNPPTKGQTLKVKKKRRLAQAKKYNDRRKRLILAVDQKNKMAKLAAERLKAVMANEKKDVKKIAQIKNRKEAAEAAAKMAREALKRMDDGRAKRAPKKFDLTTRNGAIGNYHFSSVTTAAAAEQPSA